MSDSKSNSPDGVKTMGHAYDGIEEFDNPLPGWWTALFWLTVVFSAAYFPYYHMGSAARGVIAEYQEEQRLAAEARARLPKPEVPGLAALSAMAKDPAAVEAGRARFVTTCAACHGQKGEGLIGPNLTDNHWITGDGSLSAIEERVRMGTPDKGMPAWGAVLKPEELAQVVVFVETLKGTFVAGKAPQGQQVQ